MALRDNYNILDQIYEKQIYIYFIIIKIQLYKKLQSSKEKSKHVCLLYIIYLVPRYFVKTIQVDNSAKFVPICRFLNSGGFLGSLAEVRRLLEAGGDLDNTEDDQLFYTRIYLNQVNQTLVIRKI